MVNFSCYKISFLLVISRQGKWLHPISSFSPLPLLITLFFHKVTYIGNI